MRYVKGHGLQTRSRIVEEASYGLRQAGADRISVSDLKLVVEIAVDSEGAHVNDLNRP